MKLFSSLLFYFFLWGCHMVLVNSQWYSRFQKMGARNAEVPKQQRKAQPNKMVVPTGRSPWWEGHGNKYPACSNERSKTGSSSTPKCVTTIQNLGLGNLVSGTTARDDGLLPSWINLPLAKKGQIVFGKYYGAIYLAFLTTNLLFLMTPEIAEVILFSVKAHKESSNPMEKFSKVYTAAVGQFSLYSRDGLGEDSDTENVLTSIKNIRKRHLRVVELMTAEMDKSEYRNDLEQTADNYKLKYTKFWEALDKDVRAAESLEPYHDWPKSYSSTLDSAVPINQFTLAMAQWILCGLVVGFPEAVLIHSARDEDLIAFNHLFAVLGYALGIQDEYNVALQPSLEKQKKFSREILYHYFIPALFNSTKSSKMLVETIADSLAARALPVAYNAAGISETQVSVTMEGLMIRLLKDYVGIKADYLEEASSPETRAFTQYYEESFRPASFRPGFHEAVSHTESFALYAAGVKTFGPKVYSTDENIAHWAFLPELKN